MALLDNRQFTKALKQTGDLVEVNREVDWDCEIGAIVRRACEMEGPATLFNSIRDYPGHRIFGGPVSTLRRAAVAMGIQPTASTKEIFDQFYQRMQNPIPPVLVAEAPCQENVVVGDAVDLTMFPAPMVHDGDGGRYLCTWHFVVTKDPETGWVNWGMYRVMVHNERHMGGIILATSDAGKMKLKYERMGKPMPFAIAIGPEPVCAISAAVPLPANIDEVDVAGGLAQEPVRLVRCKTVDLEVPANSEIVLEGEILHDVEVEEGPFGEYTGYRSGPRAPRAVYRVNCITWRNNPITVISNMGMPVDEGQICYGTLGVGSGVRQALEAAGIPITGVFVPPYGAGNLIIVGTRKPYNHIATQISQIVFGSRAGMPANFLIVVDDTTDVYNIGKVLHALATKCHWRDGVMTFPAWGNPLAPFLSLRERATGRGGRIVLDCTWPVEWDPEAEKPVKSSFADIYPKELQEKVLRDWHVYGFE
ncbi:MAG: UbiD family decarboxylase [Clostridia bacterium]|nr:MAG: UbiD family decarboxylase [Clostridia bacterium]